MLLIDVSNRNDFLTSQHSMSLLAFTTAADRQRCAFCHRCRAFWASRSSLAAKRHWRLARSNIGTGVLVIEPDRGVNSSFS